MAPPHHKQGTRTRQNESLHRRHNDSSPLRKSRSSVTNNQILPRKTTSPIEKRSSQATGRQLLRRWKSHLQSTISGAAGLIRRTRRSFPKAVPPLSVLIISRLITGASATPISSAGTLYNNIPVAAGGFCAANPSIEIGTQCQIIPDGLTLYDLAKSAVLVLSKPADYASDRSCACVRATFEQLAREVGGLRVLAAKVTELQGVRDGGGKIDRESVERVEWVQIVLSEDVIAQLKATQSGAWDHFWAVMESGPNGPAGAQTLVFATVGVAAVIAVAATVGGVMRWLRRPRVITLSAYGDDRRERLIGASPQVVGDDDDDPQDPLPPTRAQHNSNEQHPAQDPQPNINDDRRVYPAAAPHTPPNPQVTPTLPIHLMDILLEVARRDPGTAHEYLAWRIRFKNGVEMWRRADECETYKRVFGPKRKAFYAANPGAEGAPIRPVLARRNGNGNRNRNGRGGRRHATRLATRR